VSVVFCALENDYKAIRARFIQGFPCVHSFVENEEMRVFVGCSALVVFHFKIYHIMAFKGFLNWTHFSHKIFSKEKKEKKRKHSRQVEGFKKASFF
jgi:hypothetical protein